VKKQHHCALRKELITSFARGALNHTEGYCIHPCFQTQRHSRYKVLEGQKCLGIWETGNRHVPPAVLKEYWQQCGKNWTITQWIHNIHPKSNYRT